MLPKKLSWLFLILCWLPAAFAESSRTTNPYSHVTITNNTREEISVDTQLNTIDPDFKRGRDWDAWPVLLKAYEKADVLWFSRNSHVKKDQHYQFSIHIKPRQQSNDQTLIHLSLKGNAIYGSSVKSSITLGNNQLYPVLDGHDFDIVNDIHSGQPITVYAKSRKPFSSVFSNFHFAIDKPPDTLPDTTNTKQISLLSYNIQMMPFYANGVDDLNQPDIRANDIPGRIQHYDVVILQELFDKNKRNTVIQLMNNYYPYQTRLVGHQSPKPLSGGVMIFSKWPIIKEEQIVFRVSSGMDYFAAKGAIHVMIKKDNTYYHIIGTHLQAGNTTKDKQTRLKQLGEIKNFIETLNIPSSEAVFIAGDFNIKQSSKEFSEICNMLNVNTAKNDGYPYSFDSMINTMAVGSERSRLDYIFYRQSNAAPEIALNRIYVLRDLDNPAMWPKFDLSDHFPIAGFFDFTQSP